MKPIEEYMELVCTLVSNHTKETAAILSDMLEASSCDADEIFHRCAVRHAYYALDWGSPDIVEGLAAHAHWAFGIIPQADAERLKDPKTWRAFLERNNETNT